MFLNHQNDKTQTRPSLETGNCASGHSISTYRGFNAHMVEVTLYGSVNKMMHATNGNTDDYAQWNGKYVEDDSSGHSDTFSGDDDFDSGETILTNRYRRTGTKLEMIEQDEDVGVENYTVFTNHNAKYWQADLEIKIVVHYNHIELDYKYLVTTTIKYILFKADAYSEVLAYARNKMMHALNGNTVQVTNKYNIQHHVDKGDQWSKDSNDFDPVLNNYCAACNKPTPRYSGICWSCIRTNLITCDSCGNKSGNGTSRCERCSGSTNTDLINFEVSINNKYSKHEDIKTSSHKVDIKPHGLVESEDSEEMNSIPLNVTQEIKNVTKRKNDVEYKIKPTAPQKTIAVKNKRNRTRDRKKNNGKTYHIKKAPSPPLTIVQQKVPLDKRVEKDIIPDKMATHNKNRLDKKNATSKKKNNRTVQANVANANKDSTKWKADQIQRSNENRYKKEKISEYTMVRFIINKTDYMATVIGMFKLNWFGQVIDIPIVQSTQVYVNNISVLEKPTNFIIMKFDALPLMAGDDGSMTENETNDYINYFASYVTATATRALGKGANIDTITNFPITLIHDEKIVYPSTSPNAEAQYNNWMMDRFGVHPKILMGLYTSQNVPNVYDFTAEQLFGKGNIKHKQKEQPLKESNFPELNQSNSIPHIDINVDVEENKKKIAIPKNHNQLVEKKVSGSKDDDQPVMNKNNINKEVKKEMAPVIEKEIVFKELPIPKDDLPVINNLKDQYEVTVRPHAEEGRLNLNVQSNEQQAPQFLQQLQPLDPQQLGNYEDQIAPDQNINGGGDPPSSGGDSDPSGSDDGGGVDVDNRNYIVQQMMNADGLQYRIPHYKAMVELFGMYMSCKSIYNKYDIWTLKSTYNQRTGDLRNINDTNFDILIHDPIILLFDVTVRRGGMLGSIHQKFYKNKTITRRVSMELLAHVINPQNCTSNMTVTEIQMKMENNFKRANRINLDRLAIFDFSTVVNDTSHFAALWVYKMRKRDQDFYRRPGVVDIEEHIRTDIISLTRPCKILLMMVLMRQLGSLISQVSSTKQHGQMDFHLDHTTSGLHTQNHPLIASRPYYTASENALRPNNCTSLMRTSPNSGDLHEAYLNGNLEPFYLIKSLRLKNGLRKEITQNTGKRNLKESLITCFHHLRLKILSLTPSSKMNHMRTIKPPEVFIPDPTNLNAPQVLLSQQSNKWYSNIQPLLKKCLTKIGLITYIKYLTKIKDLSIPLTTLHMKQVFQRNLCHLLRLLCMIMSQPPYLEILVITLIWHTSSGLSWGQTLLSLMVLALILMLLV